MTNCGLYSYLQNHLSDETVSHTEIFSEFK